MHQNEDVSKNSVRIIQTPVFIRVSKVKQKTGLAISSIYALMAKKQFPLTVQLSEKSVGWIESEIDDWIDNRIKSRDMKQGGI